MAPASVLHRSRRGERGEVTLLSAQVGPSEAEGPEGGAEAGRCPRAGRRSGHCIVHQRGSLGAAAPKPVFAYFCLAAKVGRARGHEISPGRGVPETHRIRGTKSPLTRVCQKHPVPGARNLPRQVPPKRQWREGSPFARRTKRLCPGRGSMKKCSRPTDHGTRA